MAALQASVLATIARAAAESSAAEASTPAAASTAAPAQACGGDYPVPWLLLDLRQLLPASSRQASKLPAEEARLCRELDAAAGDPARAQRMAATLLAKILRDNSSARELVELASKNSSLWHLCLDSVTRSDRVLLADVAWEQAGRRATVLQAAQRMAGRGAAERQHDVADAAAEALQALQIAMQALVCETELQLDAVMRHSELAATVLVGAVAAAGSLPAGSKGVLSDLLSWWAQNAPELACALLRKGTCPSLRPIVDMAGAFLDLTVPRALRRVADRKQLQRGATCSRLAAVLDGLCHLLALALDARAPLTGLLQLLARHAPNLAELLCALLLAPSGSEQPQPGSDAEAQRDEAARSLLQLADTVASIHVQLEEGKLPCSYQPSQHLTAMLSAALSAAAHGSAGCLAWLSVTQQDSLCHGCSVHLRALQAARSRQERLRQKPLSQPYARPAQQQPAAVSASQSKQPQAAPPLQAQQHHPAVSPDTQPQQPQAALPHHHTPDQPQACPALQPEQQLMVVPAQECTEHPPAAAPQAPRYAQMQDWPTAPSLPQQPGSDSWPAAPALEQHARKSFAGFMTATGRWLKSVFS